MYAEQQMNAFKMVRELGLAVEIKIDYIRDFKTEETEGGVMTAEEIESGIRQLMDGGDEISEKVKEMSGKSRAAVQGSILTMPPGTRRSRFGRTSGTRANTRRYRVRFLVAASYIRVYILRYEGLAAQGTEISLSGPKSLSRTLCG
ncbi:hypothetical protein Acr_23g0007080 [Actinidia rufa]|uniref:Uncharacterized protein n=1 Tax=Actinidia rufa TaxID=165716 RepID=A0A7J0GNH7_9ERIC|nr:hypothetical protein Acr_23g0007080 [Actinidia rufa]